jgi:hypothetical protein
MIKYYYILLTMILLIHENKAQKVDIDNYRVEFEVVDFPKYYTPEDQRTYSVQVRGSRSLQPRIDPGKINLYGFKQVENEGTIKLVIDVNDLNQGTANKNVRVEEQKDKDGKVLSKTDYYSFRSKNISESYLSMYGPKTAKDAAAAAAKVSKEEAKKSSNPFLRGTENKNATASDVGQNYSLYERSTLNMEYDYVGAESTNEKTAFNNYQGGSGGAFSNHLVRLPDDLIARVNSYSNGQFGYSPQKLYYQKMKILDRKDHPEYKTFGQATEAAKVLFKNLKYNSDMESFKTDFEPIISYFKELDGKLKTTDKNQNKLKAATLYNIAMIQTTLDQLDDALATCKKIIANGQDEDDAEDLMKKINEIKPQMEKHKMTTRHIKF